MFHILLVEDNPGDVLMIRETIRQYNIDADVTVAYEGAKALNLLNAPDFKPDVIVLDLNIPRFNGLEILKLTQREGRPPVVIFTSSTSPADKMQAMELGAREYLVKPSDLAEYMNVLREALQRWTGGNRAASAADSG